MKKLFFLFSIQMFFAQDNFKNLVWEENFNGVELDSTAWNFELGNGCPNLCGWGNNEAQIYTTKNHKLINGLLYIDAKKINNIYTSTRITTKAKKEFRYGKIEVKAKLPKGSGLWPAFWMLGSNISEVGWPKCGEIDILEYVGKNQSIVFTSLHTQDSFGNTINTKQTSIEKIEQGFHIYGIDWTAEKIDFFIDKILVYSFKPETKTADSYPFNQPFYFLLNLAIGGNFGGPVINDAVLPQTFIIDYIKVYQ